MALEKLTKIDGGGISTTSDYRVGVITATKFVGPIEGSITSTDATFSGNVSIGGTLTYEDVTNIDSVGLITARNGIEVSTGTATTALVVNGDARVTGILTVGTGSLTLDGPNNLVNVGTALTLGHTQGLQFHTQNLHSAGFEINQINASGIITATGADINGDLDVDGHTNLDNLSVAGVSTFSDGKVSFDALGNISGRYINLDQGNGTKYIDANLANGNSISLRGYIGGSYHHLADFIRGGLVRLNYNGNGKLETSNTGVTVTGTVVATGADINGDLDVAGITTHNDDVLFTTGNGGNILIDKSDNSIRLGQSVGLFYGTNKMWMQHNGSVGYLHNVTGSLYIRNEDSSGDIYIQGKSGEHSIICNYDGNVQLYNDGTIRFNTTSTGVTVHGSANPDLKIRQGASSSSGSGFLAYENVDGNGQPRSIAKIEGKTTGNGGYGELNFQTQFNNSLSTRWTIDSSGHFLPGAVGSYNIGSATAEIGDVFLADSKRVFLGSDQDASIYHDGTHGYLTNATGNLFVSNTGTNYTYVDSNFFRVRNSSGNHMFDINTGGSHQGVGLYYSPGSQGSEKLRTSSSGITVTGTVVADGISVGNGEHISLGNSNQFKLYHDGSNAALQTTSGNTYLYGGGGNFLIRPVNAEQGLNVIANGAVELFHNDVKVCTTTTEGIRVQGAEGGGGKVEIYADEGDDNADKWHLLANTDGTLLIRNLSDGSWDTNIKLSSISTELYADDDRVFFTETRGVRIGDATKIFEDSTHASAVIQNTDIHHSIILRGSSNAAGTTITPGNTTTFREYGNFIFRTGAINAQERFIIEAGGTCKFIKGVEGGTDEDIAKFIPDGAVELYHNNAKKLETQTNGVTVTGNVVSNHSNGQIVLQATDGSIELTRTAGGAYIDFKNSTSEDYDCRINEEGGHLRTNVNFRLYDNKALEIGNRTSSTYGDLRLFHDASDSYIENHTGVFFIQNTGDLRIRVDNTDAAIHCVRDGGVELYHAGTQKFTTASDGISVAGSIYNSSSVNSTGDKGIQMGNGHRLGFDQTGTRSWTMKATGGNLTFNSGDGNGEHQFNTGVNITGRLTLPTTDTGITFGPGSASNDHAHIEWKGGDNSGYLRISVDDDTDTVTPAEYIEFGDYATQNRGGTFTQHVKIARSEFLVRTGAHNVTVADRFKIDSNGITRIYKDLYLTDELNMTDGGNKNRFIDASLANNEALFIRSTQNGDAGHQNMALFHRNSSVDLYHAGTKKIATQAHGINVYGDIHMGGESNTGTNQNRQIYWTGFDKEASGDNSDFAHIKHTTNIHGITGSVLEIKAENDASDGIALAASNGNGIVAAVCKKFDVSGYIEPSPGSGDNGIKWQPDPFGGSGDIATMQYYADGSGENTRLRILVANDGDDDLYLQGSGVHAQGNFTKSSGSFRIPHVLTGLTTTTDLVHSFIEGPQADNLYRGRTKLVAGISTVNIDTTNNMTDGTFVNLNRDVQCFTSNETGWTAVKGSVTGNLLTIVAQDNTCTDTISWMVVGERWDLHMYDPRNPMTDANGKVKTEVPNRNYDKGYNEDYISENRFRVGISTISRPSIENKEVE